MDLLPPVPTTGSPKAVHVLSCLCDNACRAADHEFALFEWSGGSPDTTKHQILLKLGQNMRIYLVSHRLELQKEVQYPSLNFGWN